MIGGGLRRPDARRARSCSAGQVRARARGAGPRRRPRAQPRDRRRRDLRARRDVRRPDPGPRSSRSRRRWASRRSRPSTTGENVYYVDGERSTLQRHRAHRHRAAGPADRWRTWRTTVTQLDEMSNEVPVDAPWDAPKRRTSGTARRSRPGSTTTARRAALPPARAARDPADLRRRAARAVAAVRALLHRRLGRRDAPRHVRAQLQHARRRADVPPRAAARSGSRSSSPPRSARA